MMFKVVSGLSATRFPPYISNKRRQGTRQFHPKKFVQVSAKTNKHQHSCIARTIKEWSSLPESLKSSQWKLSNRLSDAMFKKKTLCPKLFYHYLFIYLFIYLALAPCLVFQH